MIYVCGDSFATPDPAYGPCWVDLLAQRWHTVSLGVPAATNLLIARQVDQAIAQGAQFVIVLGTAVTRGEKRVGNTYQPFSYHTASDQTTQFSPQQLKILRDYYTEFFDLDLAIYQNAITIEHTLAKLQASGIPFRFDQGGFEHPSFGGAGLNYFGAYAANRSRINLWDHADKRTYRPYYHITDPAVHRTVADYYTQEIEQYI